MIAAGTVIGAVLGTILNKLNSIGKIAEDAEASSKDLEKKVEDDFKAMGKKINMVLKPWANK